VTDIRIAALLEGRLHEPHAFLGTHTEPTGIVARIFDPHARRVWLRTNSA